MIRFHIKEQQQPVPVVFVEAPVNTVEHSPVILSQSLHWHFSEHYIP